MNFYVCSVTAYVCCTRNFINLISRLTKEHNQVSKPEICKSHKELVELAEVQAVVRHRIPYGHIIRSTAIAEQSMSSCQERQKKDAPLNIPAANTKTYVRHGGRLPVLSTLSWSAFRFDVPVSSSPWPCTVHWSAQLVFPIGEYGWPKCACCG